MGARVPGVIAPKRFCQLEQEEIMRYKNKEKKYERGTIGAEGL